MVQQTAPRYSFSYGYRQVFFPRSLVGGFSLQSWCVQGSIGSAEGSVLPPSDGNQCGKMVVWEVGYKRFNQNTKFNL